MLADQQGADEIIDHYIQRHSSTEFQWTTELKEAVKEVCGGNLWLLSYALEGCNGQGEPMSWIREGVRRDLDDIENPSGANCNIEIVFALAPLAMNEIVTAQSLLIHDLGFDRKEINQLVKCGEITSHELRYGKGYSLPHSSLAKAYWEHGLRFEEPLKHSKYTEMIYRSVVAMPSDMLNTLYHLDTVTAENILERLAREGKSLTIIEKAKDDDLDHWLAEAIVNQRGFNRLDRIRIPDYYLTQEFLNDFLHVSFAGMCKMLLEARPDDNSAWFSEIWQSFQKDEFISRVCKMNEVGCMCRTLESIYRFDECIKPQLLEIVDIEVVALRANASSDIMQICSAVESLIKIDKAFGLRLWDSLDKKRFRNIVSGNGLYACIWLSAIADESERIKSEICGLIDCAELALTANKSRDIRVLDNIEYLFKFDRKIGMAVWNRLDQEGFLESLYSCKSLIYVSHLEDVAVLDERIKLDICRLLDCERLAVLLNQTSDLWVLNQAIWSLFRLDCDIGRKIYSLLELSMRKKLIEDEDGYCQIVHVLNLCKLKVNLEREMVDVIDDNIIKYAAVSVKGRWASPDAIVMPWHYAPFFDDIIARYSPQAANKLYSYICEQSTMEKYIGNIIKHRKQFSVDLGGVFLSEVDPDNKHKWRERLC